jgi:elongation factor Ts
MAITVDQIKRLREESGAGFADIKAALEEAGGNEQKAKEVLRQRGFEKANKKAERATEAGIVEMYVHATGRAGAAVVLATETDFVARHEDFKKLAKELAMQVCAMNPKDINDLLGQAYIRDESKTIDELIKEHIARFGENITVREFRRFSI